MKEAPQLEVPAEVVNFDLLVALRTHNFQKKEGVSLVCVYSLRRP